MRQFDLVLALLIVPLCSCEGPAEVPPWEHAPMTITLESSAFAEGEMIPRKYTCDGENVSPPLAWSGIPDTARTLLLICDDPDAPMGTWTHWIVFNLSPRATSLPENVPPDGTIRVHAGSAEHSALQGRNDFKKVGYGGPCPPGGTHRYYFRLSALDVDLPLRPGASRKDVLKAIEGHVVAQGELMGRYTRSH